MLLRKTPPTFDIVWSDEDGEFMVTCSAYPRLSAFGQTKEDALAEAEIAFQLFTESYKQRGLKSVLADGD